MSDRRGPTASERWITDLRAWGIPEHIVERAPQSPWIHPPESFRPSALGVVDTPSRRRAVEALATTATGRVGGSVLDVGCGGGRASFALAPYAELIVGVDRQEGMLDLFTAEADRRGIDSRAVLGAWPDIAPAVPMCDVAVCHHVLFNVPELVAFVEALTERTRRCVVVELSMHHPLANLSGAWKRFWDLDRPTGPTALDAIEVLGDMGLAVGVEEFELPDPKADGRRVTDQDVEHTRIRLCLTPDRDREIRSFLEQLPRPPRRFVTVWWST